MRIVRDGIAETIDCPKQRIIPHDMVHYAVEHTLQTCGFLRRAGLGEAANFQMTPEPHSDGVERLVEVLQGDEWSGGHTAPDELLELYRVTCEARDCPMLGVTTADVRMVREKIRELDSRWQALAVGESMTLRL